MKRIDLHTHSNKSDGTLTPTELIAEAKAAGLSAIALTDHDTLAGLDEALVAARHADIECVPGVELSVSHMSREIHILGLFIHPEHPGLQNALEDILKDRDLRNEKMIAKMQEHGVDITSQKLFQSQGGPVLTRANFAAYLLAAGFVASMKEAFDKYLDHDKIFYIPREYLNPERAIDLIHDAGGKAILAHPLLYRLKTADLERAVADFTDMGLDGLEAYYSMNCGYETQQMIGLAGKYHLLTSGGSDFHGANKPHIKLGTGRGNLVVPDDILDLLRS